VSKEGIVIILEGIILKHDVFWNNAPASILKPFKNMPNFKEIREAVKDLAPN